MKEIVLVIIGILVGLIIGAIINICSNFKLTIDKPFIINDKTYICREQIVSYKDINQNN